MVAPVNTSDSKPVTRPAKVPLPDAVAAKADVIFNVSVPLPPSTVPVGAVPLPRVRLSFPEPSDIALVGAVAVSVTVSTPAPPANVALEASIVTVLVPVVADVLTEVTVAPDRSAFRPAEPLTVTVLKELAPALEFSVSDLLPLTDSVFSAPNVRFARVELAPVVVTFNVV